MSHTVVVLAGGLSHERDVSMRSGRRVALALRHAGHTVIESDLNGDLINLLSGVPSPVVFPLLHGAVGEDGALREVLSLLHVPFVGSSAAASRLAFDKPVASRVVSQAGVRIPRQVALPHDIFRELGAAKLVSAIGTKLGFPLIVKPAKGGSALGVRRVDEVAALPSAMVGAYAYDPVALIESFINGTEVAVTLLDSEQGRQALPAVEIRPESGAYDYASRYTAGDTRFVTPADLDAETTARVADAALRCAEALGLKDLSRVDMVVDAEAVPVFLEANVAPGMTETSLVPLAMEAAGLDLGTVCSKLVERAAARG